MENFNFSILLLFGIGIFGGISGAWLFQRFNIPQVIGYIIIGLLIGETGLQVVKQSDILNLQSFNWFALGIIGFLVGGELKLEIFRKYAKQFTAILLGEGLGAFFLVGFPVFFIIFHITNSVSTALAAGIVLGAIASATDPASTINVLWEYRAKGVLTTALIATIALDDALAMALYGLGTSIAQILIGGPSQIFKEILNIIKELFGSILAGVLAGLLTNFIIKHLDANKEKILTIAIGILLLVIGFSDAAGLDVILATMSMGVTLINLSPKRSEELFSLIKNFSVPIYVMFFVLVGARLNISNMPLWLWAIIIVYVIGRSLGKIFGSYAGAKWAKADKNVQKYTGIGLFAQGGVAIGLSIMASHHLSGIKITETISLGDMIIFGVTATTLIVQIIGPPLVKLAIQRAGEINRNITKDDIIDSLKVNDVMEKNLILVKAEETISKILQLFSSYDFLSYPVVNDKNMLLGTITLDNLKEVLTDQECWDWLVAEDVLIPLENNTIKDTPLKDAFIIMRTLGVEQIPIVESITNPQPVGILDTRKINKFLEQELIIRTKDAA